MRLSLVPLGVAAVTVSALVGCSGASTASAADGGASGMYGAGGEPAPSAEALTYPKLLDPQILNPDATPAGAEAVIAKAMLPPVLNQGSLNSCGAFGLGYALGSFTIAAPLGTIADVSSQLSPAYLYKTALGEMMTTCAADGSGSSATDYLEYLVNNAGAPVRAVPYVASCAYFDDRLDISASETDSALAIGSWGALSEPQSNLPLFKTILANGQPLGILVHGYPEYYQWEHQTGVLHGSTQASWSHFMLLVGYSDTLGAVRIMNSWGTAWGDGGFFWLDYDSFTQSIQEAYAAQPVGNESAGTPLTASTPTTGTAAAPARISRAFQVEDRDYPGRVHLIFEHAFGAPVRLGAIELTDPAGGHVRHVYGWSMRTGRSYVTRLDGRQWLPGSYAISMETTQHDGSAVTYTGNITVSRVLGSSLAAEKAPSSGVTGSSGQTAP